jgi:uncharacterized membrane protein YozB (DUF420 family)
MKTFSKLSILAMTFLVPSFVLAQQYLKPVEQAVGSIQRIFGLLYSLVFVMAIVAFVGGVAWIIWKKVRGEDFDKGFLLWGMIGLAVIFSIYGLIRVMQSVVGISDGTNASIGAPALPSVRTR